MQHFLVVVSREDHQGYLACHIARNGNLNLVSSRNSCPSCNTDIKEQILPDCRVRQKQENLMHLPAHVQINVELSQC